MSKASLAALSRELPDGDFAGLEDLSAEQAEFIAEAYSELRQARAEELDGAIDHALRYLPPPLRGVARKLIFGGIA